VGPPEPIIAQEFGTLGFFAELRQLNSKGILFEAFPRLHKIPQFARVDRYAPTNLKRCVFVIVATLINEKQPTHPEPPIAAAECR